MYRKLLLALIVLCCMGISARSQDKPDVVDRIANFPSSFFNKINKQSASLEDRLSFLQQNNQLLSGSNNIQQKVQRSLANINQLENKLQDADQVKAFIQQREEQIKQTFSKYTNLPPENAAHKIQSRI